MKTPRSSPAVALITGGRDKHYASELSRALDASGVVADIVCNADMDTQELRACSNLRLLPLYNVPWPRNPFRRLMNCIRVYARLIRYITSSKAPILHILWPYKLPILDSTVLLLYYKLLGKRVIFTAHNVNGAEKDGKDSWRNRWTLRFQYNLLDHIFVHTDQMKHQLQNGFGVSEERVTVIPYGVYSMVPNSSLTPAEAKQKLGLQPDHRTILFFGRIVPYKGVNYLIEAFRSIAVMDPSYRLLIAGDKETEEHWREIQQVIDDNSLHERVIQHTRHIEDNDIELYFKASDVLVLPYIRICQSGVLFMSYSFGLPVIATDIGSFRHDVIPSKTGFLCPPHDPVALSRALETFFSSDLFAERDRRRTDIQNIIRASNSWSIAGAKTAEVYAALSGCGQLQPSA